MAMRWSGYEEKDLVLMRSMGKLCLRLFKQLKPLLTMTDLVVYLVLWPVHVNNLLLCGFVALWCFAALLLCCFVAFSIFPECFLARNAGGAAHRKVV